MKPTIDWIKNDPEKHRWFEDNSKFLVALQVTSTATGTKVTRWEFSVITCANDEDGLELYHEGGDPFDAWSWLDIEWFAILEGKEPWKDL